MSAEPSPRMTRQRRRAAGAAAAAATVATSKDASGASESTANLPHEISELPTLLTPTITGLSRKDHALLLRKHTFLRTHQLPIPRSFRAHESSVSATLVFAQEEAGTAVCVSSNGLLLTCAHCVAEGGEAELEDHQHPPDPEESHWLLFASGRIVRAVCVAWDPKRDLALLRIVAAQADPGGPERGVAGGGAGTAVVVTVDEPRGTDSFPSVAVADVTPTIGAPLFCVGHPGSEDLEAGRPGVATGYDVLHVSNGAFRGFAPGQDRQDNAEIGALMHDCWTYWGHSGAPLLDRATGRLVGLHSSWDDETGMRRGVGLEAVAAFLVDNK